MPIRSTRQSGIALVLVLVFLSVLTIIGLSGMRMAKFSEQMAGATMDHVVALSASEAATREGALAACGLMGLAPPTARATDVLTIMDPINDGQTVYAWRSSNFDWMTGPVTPLSGEKLTRVAAQPAYVFDSMVSPQLSDGKQGGRAKLIRITARGVGARTTSESMSQQYLEGWYCNFE